MIGNNSNFFNLFCATLVVYLLVSVRRCQKRNAVVFHGRKMEIIQMAWCNESPGRDEQAIVPMERTQTLICPSCNHSIQLQDQVGVEDLPGLPAGVKFDPSDQVILEHLEAKVSHDLQSQKLHPLIDKFIPTLEGENGICYTHPDKLPGDHPYELHDISGVNKDGQIRHFFHRPLKAYTTGTRKRRKVHTDEQGGETRWHKTGKTRPVFIAGSLKGFKKILVLYTNYGRQKKPEKTNWVMHQYHLGDNEEEKEGELVVSKVFYQTQPRQCAGSSVKAIDNESQPNKLASSSSLISRHDHNPSINDSGLIEFYNPNFISYNNGGGQNREMIHPCQADGPLLYNLQTAANKGGDGSS